MAGNKPSVKLQRAKIRSAASLSPAGSQTSDDIIASPPDLSVLRKSIKTSVTGFPHARDVYDTGTEELKQLLSAECDIIYECRVCRNLFRSLANFISHKRVYCSEKFNSSLHPHFNNDNRTRDDVGTILQYEEDYQKFVKNKDGILNGDKNADGRRKKISAVKDLTSIIEKLLRKNQRENNSDDQTDDVPMRHIKFQSIPDSDNAIYQNVYSNKLAANDFIKDQIAELDRLISSNEAILGPDGKLLSRDHLALSSSNGNTADGNSQIDLFCDICKINFATQKTLKLHMKIKHAENRLVYPCPDCTDTFSNSWSVFRHLFKVHRKSATHIRKLRETIQNKAFKINMTAINENKRKACEANRESITEQQRMDQENQAWIDNLEGDGDIPRCGGCGKRFERRAALSAHRQTCQLRKTAQNKINTNLQRRTIPKLVPKDVEETTLPEVTLKIPKIEKPTERKIEIKIRRDYNKASPLSIRTNSPALADDDSNMVSLDNIDPANINSVIGENDYDFSSINFSNSDIQDDSNFMETVKDCDDANVDENYEKNTDNGHNINKECTFIDDGDLSFDDIRRICHEDSNQLSNKACGQNKTISQLNVDHTKYSEVDNLFIKSDNTKNCIGNDNHTVNIDNIKTELQDSNSTKSYDENDIINKYVCEYCKSTFKLKQNLEKHIIRHLACKKFDCKQCGIKFSIDSHYKKHMESHRPQEEMESNSKQLNDSVVCKDDIDDSRNNPTEEVFDEYSGRNPKIKIEVEDELSETTSDYQKLSLQVEKYKPRSSYKQLKRKRRLMKKSQTANQKKSTVSEDSLNSSDQPQFTPFSKLEPMLEEVIGKIKNTIPIKLKDKSGMKLKRMLTKTTSSISYKKCNQHIASSESYTVQRPVRNRVKLFDKDFEYDSSYLPRLKVENRESSITTVLSSQKPQLKRKQFLQSEMLAAELSKPWEEMDQINEKESPLTPKPYQGALQTISLKVASKGKALLKAKQLVITRRNTPPYIRIPYRPPADITKTQKATVEKQTPNNPQPNAPEHGVLAKIVLPLKTIPMKLVQSPSTVLKISEKSYLGKIQRKIGMPVTLLPQKLTVLTQKPQKNQMKFLTGIQKKTAQHSQTLPMKSLKNLDHQALDSKVTYQAGEISMLTKSQLKEKSPESSSSLSILPSNGNSNNSSFVNISLKQLKNMQREHSPYHIPDKTLIKKNIYALKNLEDNNEIRISKVVSDKSDSKSCANSKIPPKLNKEAVCNSMTKTFNRVLSIKRKSMSDKIDSAICHVKNDTPSESSGRSDERVINIYDDISDISRINLNSKEPISPTDPISNTPNDNDFNISATDSGRKFYYNNKITNSLLKDSENAFYETAKCVSSNDNTSHLD